MGVQEYLYGDSRSLTESITPPNLPPGKLADIKMTTQGERDLISGLIEGHCANAETERGEKMFPGDGLISISS